MYVSLALHKEEYDKHLKALLALRFRTSFAYRSPNLQKLKEDMKVQKEDPANKASACDVPNVQKFEDKKVQKEEPAKEASSCDDDLGGFVLVDKSPSNSEWDMCTSVLV